MNDTICAIATTIGESSINIIRISGNDSIYIVNKIFDKDLNIKKSHTVTYGHIIHNNEIIDEVLVSIFLSPKTFTKENIVEISTHGGSLSVSKVMELLLKEGCRLAEPGEFLKRAYLNGRIDLTEAESVSDLIMAKTENSRKMAVKGINKELKVIINELRKKIISLIGNIEVNIDYPEYEDAEIITIGKIGNVLDEVYSEINKLVNESEKGLLIKNGVNIAIVGKPNVGKSSVLNALINKNKAIVTDIKGTTRDIVEDSLTINGILVNFMDTAGIRKTNDNVERIGVERSLSAIEDADLILFVVDSSNELDREDKEILNIIKNKRVLIVCNKIDKSNIMGDLLNQYNCVEVSAINKTNIDLLKEKISEILNFNEINNNDVYISNTRQIALLNKCKKTGENIKESIKLKMPIDIVEVDVKELWNTLGEITGETYKEELIDEIFSKFCLGK